MAYGMMMTCTKMILIASHFKSDSLIKYMMKIKKSSFEVNLLEEKIIMPKGVCHVILLEIIVYWEDTI